MKVSKMLKLLTTDRSTVPEMISVMGGGDFLSIVAARCKVLILLTCLRLERVLVSAVRYYLQFFFY